MQIFLDSMGGGAWPFLVGGVICLVNSVNERDLSLLTSPTKSLFQRVWLARPLQELGLWLSELLRGTVCI